MDVQVNWENLLHIPSLIGTVMAPDGVGAKGETNIGKYRTLQLQIELDWHNPA